MQGGAGRGRGFDGGLGEEAIDALVPASSCGSTDERSAPKTP